MLKRFEDLSRTVRNLSSVTDLIPSRARHQLILKALRDKRYRARPNFTN